MFPLKCSYHLQIVTAFCMAISKHYTFDVYINFLPKKDKIWNEYVKQYLVHVYWGYERINSFSTVLKPSFMPILIGRSRD